MKVLMLSKACISGAYQRKLEEIAALGVELTVVVPSSWKDERGVLPLEKRFLKGYRLIVAPMRFNGHFHLHYYPTLVAIMRECTPEVVHVDEEPWDFVTYRAVRAAIAVDARPLFFTWQNLLRRLPWPFVWLERYVYRHCRTAIAGNSDAVSVLRSRGFAGTLSVIPQFGVDTEMFAPAMKPAGHSASGQPYTIGYAGRLIAVKGLDTLLRACSRLGGDWQLRIAGAGPERENLRKLAAQLGVAERVAFEPQLGSTEMPDFYRRLDVFVLPSRRARNWSEQFGRVLIEAMACGVPVLAAQSGESPNTVGDAGLLFPVDDVAALRAQLERVRSDEKLRCELVERGRARVLARYTQASVARRTVEVYQALLRVV